MKPPKKIRLNESVYRMPGQAYFFTIVSDFKRPYFTNRDFNMGIIGCLKDERMRMQCNIFVYCLMPEHLHFIAGTTKPGISILEFVNQYKGKSTRIAWKYNIEPSLWQRRSYDHVIRKEENLIEIAMYILNNPVRRGLVEQWEDYEYGGLLDEFPV